MAKKKGGKSKGYISKGLHANVCSWLKKTIRNENRANPDLIAMLRREAYRTMIIAKPRNDKERKLRDRYTAENDVAQAASGIFNRYICVGITWGRVIQAVKTGKIDELEKKWGPIRDEFLAKNRGLGAMSYGLRP